MFMFVRDMLDGEASIESVEGNGILCFSKVMSETEKLTHVDSLNDTRH